MNFQEQLEKVDAWRKDAPAEQKEKLNKLFALVKQIDKLPQDAQEKIRNNIRAIAEKLEAKEKQLLQDSKQLEKKAVEAVQKAEEVTKAEAAKVVKAKSEAAAKPEKAKKKSGPTHAGETFFGRAKMIQLQKNISWAEAKAEAKKFFAKEKEQKAAAVQQRIQKFKGAQPKAYDKAVKDTQDVERDSARPAKPFGKRPSRAGAKRPFYWEGRSNRADVKQPPKTYPKLQRGGSIDDIGEVNAMPVMRRGGLLASGKFSKYGLREQGDVYKRLEEMMQKTDDYCQVMPDSCRSSLDIERINMPQINSKDYDDYVDFLRANGIKTTSTSSRRVDSLKPTQNELSLPRVKKILDRLLSNYYKNEKGEVVSPLKYRLIVTKDGHILDGHHRWATALILSPENRMPVIELDTDIEKLLSVTKGYDKADFKEFAKGGRPKSAHHRDHKYLSDEEYEKRYAPNTKKTARYKQDKFAEGGKVSPFNRLANKVAKQYEGKRVPSKYQSDYGSTYDKSEAREVGNKVAGKVARKQLAKKVSAFYLAKKANGGTIELFRQGGNVGVRIINEGQVWDKKRFQGVMGDYDRDGVANADDIAPRNKEISGRVDDQSFAETLSDLLVLKNGLDAKMYAFVDKLKDVAPQKGKILARTKTPYSILKKLVEKRLTDKKKGLSDLIGTTIVTENKAQLDLVARKINAGALGQVIEFEDMYAAPKNGYRAYHYLIDYDGTTIELQLKTARQKALNELSHEPYKANELNGMLLRKWTDVADKADRGDAEAQAKIKKFFEQPNLERVFYV